MALNNLLGPWTPVGTGTVTVNATTGAVTITPANDSTAAIARQQIATEVGKQYAFTYELQTSAQTWRMIGTAAGIGDIVGSNVSTVNETKVTFTATTTSVWVELSRTSAGTTTTGNFRFEEVPPGQASARRLNGRNQYFNIDAAAAGLRTTNSLQYAGGWFKFQYMPPAAAYLLDWAIPNAVASGGQQRARLFYDPSVPKIAASNAGSSANGNKYAENWVPSTGLTADTWHYVGIALAGDGGVRVVYDGTIGGTTTGTGVPEVASYLGTFQLGARTGSTPTLYAPVILGDWIWCSGFVPTDAQIQLLAAGNRPSDIADFDPTYYWTFNQTGTTEPSLGATATLTAPTAPATVVGPSYVVPLPAEILPLLMF